MRPSLDRAMAHWCRMLLFTVAMGLAGMASAAAQKAFPFGAELRLDAKPLKGSKRTLTIVPVSMRDDQCPQDRLKLDEEFLEKLTQVTGWRWEGFILVLDGPQPLRWRPASN